ncbi:MAG: protocatechuate 3,4-dioxygenase subunit beta, partial [Hyphomicrobiaceae bacterium]
MTNSPFRPRDWKSQPRSIDPNYISTTYRAPKKPLIPLKQTLTELTGPVYGHDNLAENDGDLTLNARKGGEPIGERIIVTGKVQDENGRPVANTLIEIWQANASGRYIHVNDQHNAPVDPNFFGTGRVATDGEVRYKFYSIKPGAYEFVVNNNAWRPPHIHLSLFGPTIATRLVTQIFFPGDPLLKQDPIFMGVPEHARYRLVSTFDIDET